MEVFAQEFLPILEQSEVDLNKFVIPEKLADLDMVIVCLDQTDTQFVEQCQKLGIDYLDISANSDFLKKLICYPFLKKARESLV